MEVISKKDHSNHREPLVFKTDDKGLFSLTLSIVKEYEFSNKQLWFTILGFERSFRLLETIIYRILPWLRPHTLGGHKQEIICFWFEVREMCVINESGDKDWFMPNQFAIRRFSEDDVVHGKALIELLRKNKIDCEFTNLKSFSGYYLSEMDVNLNRENLSTKSISCVASNATNKKHPDYFEFRIILDYPRFRITMQELDIAYRQKLFMHLFESDSVNKSDVYTQLNSDIVSQQESDDDSIVQDIPIGNFGGSIPSLTLRKNGHLQLIVDLPPFYDGDGNDIDGDEDFPEVYDFEQLISEFTGVRVVRDDREVFIIDKPHPDTARKVKEFMENYWTLRKDKYKR